MSLSKSFVPFLSFDTMHGEIKKEVMHAFEIFFDSKWYILGEQVTAFEKEYARFNKTNHCIGVSNGLDALHLALRTLGVGDGDEVIVPSNTYIASLLAISYVGATPVLAEPKTDSYNIHPDEIRRVITKKTKAIMPVHLYGQACEMDAIVDIAQKHQLYLVEDNAQSHGATFNGKITGSWGDINATSFYPGKNLGALGDAGALTTDNEILANQAKVLRNYGSQKKYYNEMIGYNMRLDECQASILSIKLKYLQRWTEERIAIADFYNKNLAGIGDLVLPATAKGATHVYHLYVIRTKQRNNLQQYLSEKGIGTLIHYPVPPHLQQAYHFMGFKKGDFPVAEEIADTCLSLPLWPGMTNEMLYKVADTIKAFFKK
jgi:dTDP-4-amino-4,6-dideoxygalactose transaminase